MKNILMKCGHIGYGIFEGKPYCIICDCAEVAPKTPNLALRKARCSYCGKLVDSDQKLPFFEHKPKSEHDSYYCGCCGWD